MNAPRSYTRQKKTHSNYKLYHTVYFSFRTVCKALEPLKIYPRSGTLQVYSISAVLCLNSIFICTRNISSGRCGYNYGKGKRLTYIHVRSWYLYFVYKFFEPLRLFFLLSSKTLYETYIPTCYIHLLYKNTSCHGERKSATGTRVKTLKFLHR